MHGHHNIKLPSSWALVICSIALQTNAQYQTTAMWCFCEGKPYNHSVARYKQWTERACDHDVLCRRDFALNICSAYAVLGAIDAVPKHTSQCLHQHRDSGPEQSYFQPQREDVHYYTHAAQLEQLQGSQVAAIINRYISSALLTATNQLV